ncbi:MAG: diacylglycerol kinase family lipid kinase [Chloroflexota bacterium]|nr:diacylglycerol kinase family lipid kinase [Chloroflexota bacterium]
MRREPVAPIADRRALAIVNPAAGSGRAASLAPRLARLLRDAGLRTDVVQLPLPGEGPRLAAEAAAEGYDTVIAVGGDGTANEVANGLVGTRAALALFPMGSGNDFARALDYPGRARDLPAFLARGSRRTIDVGEANGRVFLNVAGVGIDGEVAERAKAHARVIGSRLAYVTASVTSIGVYRPLQMSVRLDGEERSGRFLVAIASNGTHFGRGMRCAPAARLDDGLLDVTLAGALGTLASLRALARLYKGTHVDGHSIVASRARAVDIELERTSAAEIDGDVVHVRRLALRVRPAALDVIAA